MTKQEKLFFEITKSVINISQTIVCNLSDDKEANQITFDNNNIERFLLFYLINSSLSKNQTQKKSQSLLSFDDNLSIPYEKSLLFINILERKVNIFNKSLENLLRNASYNEETTGLTDAQKKVMINKEKQTEQK